MSGFRVIVDRYNRHIFQITYSVLHDVKDAEDAAQETFIQIYRSLPQYRSQGFKSWISRIALNKAIDLKRKKTRHSEHTITSVIEMETIPSNEEGPLSLTIRKEKHRLLKDKLKQLPDNHKQVLSAYYLEEKSYEQIALELQVTKNTVESKLYRAKQWIRKKWKEEDWK
ncbi:RNA polymerase sigma factor [Paenibacillus sp. IHBB 10380]|uniref:RNA polymerase sigma factor n=1 Tax=Paenibacillus sp. IHBB 10380 TaxID=1566358 RepID=UPI000AEBC5E2|nr:sigma-70 family RNA polymerase sigma factor [Paenibacillus sp. IHBB 10380]